MVWKGARFGEYRDHVATETIPRVDHGGAWPANLVRRTNRPIDWDLFEQHLEEAAFLWGEWEGALVAGNYTLGDVAAGPEMRLLAHLDALVLGGRPVADRLLVPALADDKPGRVAAAAWVLVQSGDVGDGARDNQEIVIAALVKCDPPARAAIARALRLAPRTDFSRVAQLWHQPAPELRAVALDLLRVAEPDWTREKLEPILRGDDSPTRAAALRALRAVPDRALAGLVQDAFTSELPEVCREALSTGIVLGLQASWDQCRLLAIRGGETSRLALALLAFSTRPQDRSLVVMLARDSGVRRDALWALGFAGDQESADVLVDATSDPAVAKLAGEGLSAVTGVAIEGSLATPGNTQGPDNAEVADDDSPPVVRPEDHLPLPNAAAVKQWWQHHKGQFPTGLRHIFGQPRTSQAIRAALATAPMWRREVMALELAAATNAAPVIDVKAWTRDQWRALGATSAAAPPAMARSR